ncbi:MAG: VacB/RNase II family 3'-5' exoribonuclease [Kiritimatiellae bacterium]|nr:VacB/RNase II family 3'-5' exoribonuclease [Kiritimatiellia bacterium]
MKRVKREREKGANAASTPYAPPGKTPREDTLSVMKFFSIPRSFPKGALAEAERCSMENPGKRLDLRKKFIFTCDPQTARDYDDALSFSRSPGGRCVLGVHIADVSHFVRPGGALDREAAKRSTSVYFADRVVPMLPEALSNGLCSLVPGEDRLAFSVFMEFDKDGKMVKRSFAKSIIRSKARYAYEDVMAAIDGRKDCAIGAKERKTILAINSLAQKLRARRFAAGALDIDIPETTIALDENGEMTGIETHRGDESHQLVEECMVAANEAVATELDSKKIAILSRIHEPPDADKLETLQAELKSLGVKTGNLLKRAAFARFLQSAKRHPLYPTISMMILRSMKRAEYSPVKHGHYGLAKEHYAHFTSPIRRYPDLTVHRQLAAYLEGRGPHVPPAALAEQARHSNACEQRAAEAERELLEIKKYRILQARLDKGDRPEYEATIVKCAPFGCFVEVEELAVSGLVHVSTLSRKFVRFNREDQTLSAPGGESWRIGQTMRVRLSGVDFVQRRLDFAPARRTSDRRLK